MDLNRNCNPFCRHYTCPQLISLLGSVLAIVSYLTTWVYIGQGTVVVDAYKYTGMEVVEAEFLLNTYWQTAIPLIVTVSSCVSGLLSVLPLRVFSRKFAIVLNTSTTAIGFLSLFLLSLFEIWAIFETHVLVIAQGFWICRLGCFLTALGGGLTSIYR